MVKKSWAERNQGFSLIELLIVLVILGILMSIAALPFQEMIANQRLKAAVSDLVSDLALARTEAIKRSSPVGIARTTADWIDGWRVFVDTNRNGVLDAAAGDAVDVNGNGVIDANESVDSDVDGFADTAILLKRSAVSSGIKVCTTGNLADNSIDVLTYSGDGRIRTFNAGAQKAGVTGVVISSTLNSTAVPARLLEFTSTGRITIVSTGVANCP